jgi:hypothetical protein
MIVKYPLCQLFTLDFLMAIFDLAYHDPNHRTYRQTIPMSVDAQHLKSSRSLATVDGLIWG